MADDVVLLRRRNDSGVFGPERELVFFDEPIRPESLAEIRTVQLWAPHDDRIERLPKVIGEMENFTSLTISSGSSEPSLVRERSVPVIFPSRWRSCGSTTSTDACSPGRIWCCPA